MVSLRFGLWSCRDMRSFLLIMPVKLLLSKSCCLKWLLLCLIFSEISRLILGKFISFSIIILLFHLKLSSWRFRMTGFGRLVRIESDFYELVKWQIGAETERNKLEIIIEILIRKYPIIDTLEFTVQIYWSFKSSNLWSVMIGRYQSWNLNLSSLLSIKHVK